MTNPPVGRLFPTATGHDLTLTRTFRAPIEDVWASVTESDRTAHWFGPWEGDPGPGRTIKVQMAYEEQTPWFDMTIDACDPPHRLALSTGADSGGWRVELLLAETGGRTELRFVHHLDHTDQLGEVGPGWEYYLDLLVAAREDRARPTFDDYYPSMKAYYDGLIG